MSRFVRFIVLLLIVAVVINLSMVVYSNEQSRKKQAVALQAERERLKAMMFGITDKLRRAEVAVEWQKIDATDKVNQTSILVRQFVNNEKGLLKPLPSQRVIIKGSRLVVEAVRLEFGPNFAKEYDYLRGARVAFFAHVYGEEMPPEERFNFWKPDLVPQAMQLHALEREPQVTFLESKLWQRLWWLSQNPENARQADLKISTADTVPNLKAVKNLNRGGFYEVNVGLEGVTIRESDNRNNLMQMLNEGKLLDNPLPPQNRTESPR